MDRRELVRKVFHNEPAEKLLVGFWHHYLEDETADGLHDPALIRQNLDGARKFRDAFDPDFVKVMTDGLFFFPYNYEAMQCASDFRDLRPTEDMDAYLDRCAEFAKEVRAIYGPDVLIFYNVFSPTFQISQRMSQVRPRQREFSIARLIEEDPEAMRIAMERITDDTLRLIDRTVGAGIMDGIYLSVSCYNRSIRSDVYRSVVTPSEKRIIAAANALAPDNLLHICGWRGNLNDLSLFTDYDFSVINWAVHAEGVTLAEGKRMFGGKCVIGGFGNNNTDLLCVGSRDEIRDYVEKIVDEAGTTGVIIGADCTTHLDTPDEHLRWVYEKAAEITAQRLR